GFGVGVGFAFQSGGGGGISLTVFCPCTIGADSKTASTPIKNAGPKSFFSTPDIIFDTFEPCIIPPVAGCTSYLSYRFCDGMIHDSLVPRYLHGVAHQVQLRSLLLITCTRSSRIHRRRRSSQSLVDKELD